MRIIGLLLLAASAWGAEYTIDTAHSAAGFGAKHMMVTNVRGRFSNVTGKISYDPKNLASAKVEAIIDTNTVDTQQAKRDAHLKSPDFFDVAKYPTMTFKSTKWEKAGGKLHITGDLTIHGVTKSVTLDVEGPAPEVRGPGGITIGASAGTKVNRKEFGLIWNKLMDTGGAVVSDAITITLDVEATRN
jgi:polyisoprenoid-binding protein YceI